MLGNKSSGTRPEADLHAAIRLLDPELCSRSTANDRSVHGTPDVAFPAERVAVFVNGCFWHRHGAHRWRRVRSHAGFWARKFRLNRRRDARVARRLRRAGWSVVTVWECALKAHAGREAMRVIGKVKARSL